MYSERTSQPLRTFRFVRTSRSTLTASQIRALNGIYQAGENVGDAHRRLLSRRPLGEFERYLHDAAW
jgi:hypothetical protein